MTLPACPDVARWTCEFCFATVFCQILPKGWGFVWQSAVCPHCAILVIDGGGIGVVKGGSFAPGALAPRPWRATK